MGPRVEPLIQLLTLNNLSSLRSGGEYGVLSLIAVKPAHGAVVHLEVILSTGVADPDGIEHGVAARRVLQINPGRHGNSFARFSLTEAKQHANVNENNAK